MIFERANRLSLIKHCHDSENSILQGVFIHTQNNPHPIVNIFALQHYVIKFVSDLRHVGGYRRVLLVPLPNKTDRHDIIEILLKVALNTITLTIQRHLHKHRHAASH
jgi:hypothetical protein